MGTKWGQMVIQMGTHGNTNGDKMGTNGNKHLGCGQMGQ